MKVSVLHEIYVFLSTLYGGLLIGFIYDLYRIFRCIFKPKKIATIIEDLIFWIVISATAVAVLFYSNDGQLRFYPFLGFALGAILYNILLSKAVIKNSIRFLRMVKRLLKRLCKPFTKIYRLLRWGWNCFKKRFSPLYYLLKRIGKLPGRYWLELKKYGRFILYKK
ncbi:MAG TPA: spore cortex biosynthesis protein YabQ [Clostridiales bacterium]|nr:spore cortex biosynthesis protein YabQ [Clostridiales bacterium]